jgi:hypothetical protein
MRQMQELDQSMRVKCSVFCFASAVMVFAAFVLVMGCPLSPSRAVNGPRITSVGNLHQVGITIRNYKDQQGKLPSHLSDLVPGYIPTNHIAIFYVTNNFVQQKVLPSDWKENPTQIDRYSSYVYLGTNGVRGIIAYEKTNLWKPSATYPDKVAVLFSDFHVQYMPITELQNQLR